MKTTVKLAFLPDLSMHILLFSQPETATERIFPDTDPVETKIVKAVGMMIIN